MIGINTVCAFSVIGLVSAVVVDNLVVKDNDVPAIVLLPQLHHSGGGSNKQDSGCASQHISREPLPAVVPESGQLSLIQV